MQKTERIAIVTTSYPASAQDPSGHFVATQARALCRAGHAVTVFTGGASPKASDDAGGPRVVRIADGGASGWPGLVPRLKERPARALGLAKWGFGVRRELRRHGPFQRVIAHFLLPSGFPVLFALELGGAALEFVVHGSDARLLEKLPLPVAQRILLALVKNARIRCVSHELADLLLRLAGESLAGKVYVEPLAVETAQAPSRAQARAALGFTGEERLVVIVARLIPNKRVRDALAAAALVPGVRVIVVGDGPELAALTRDYPAVHFVGRVDRARALTFIAAADALLSASCLEGAPSAVREARALDVPVAACSAGDLTRWAVSDSGLWVTA
ncbi:MAG TPA: glycosyltransferase [Polyangiaceae bacterium]|nr:glycosyltransferase [Polyangiaceae bacterium]